MTRPEDAGRHARDEAAARRAAGGYVGVPDEGALEETIVAGAPSSELLARWAMIEVDPDEVVYSTRRGGAPITFVKQLLVRLLRQYLVELEGRQTRFNIAVLERLGALERRVDRLEQSLPGEHE